MAAQANSPRRNEMIPTTNSLGSHPLVPVRGLVRRIRRLAVAGAVFCLMMIAATPANALKVPPNYPGSKDVIDCRSGKVCVRDGKIDVAETCRQFDHWWCRML
jgi:hypothetical protein